MLFMCSFRDMLHIRIVVEKDYMENPYVSIYCTYEFIEKDHIALFMYEVRLVVAWATCQLYSALLLRSFLPAGSNQPFLYIAGGEGSYLLAESFIVWFLIGWKISLWLYFSLPNCLGNRCVEPVEFLSVIWPVAIKVNTSGYNIY